MITLTVVGGLVALAALVLLMDRQARVVLHKISELERPQSTYISPEPYDDEWIKIALADLTMAVAEGINHVDRSERRVRSVVSSAKRKFEAEGYVDPGIQAESELLLELDEGSSEPEGVRDVPEDLGGGETAWHLVPGFDS